MRAYATSGFALHPQVAGTGAPDHTAIPALHRRVRDGSVEDGAWADRIDPRDHEPQQVGQLTRRLLAHRGKKRLVHFTTVGE